MCLIDIIHIIAILVVIVCFQRRHQGTLEGLGSSVCCSSGREKEQYPSIPDCTGRNDKGSMVDTRWPNHDEVQAVTAVKRLRRKRVAVNPLHSFVLGVSQHQTIIQGEMPLAFGRFLQLQGLKDGIYLIK